MEKKHYRPDIDGLRAIAVLAVVLYHANLGITGGFMGVDIFFVISGYLITKILIRSLKSDTFSLLGFWERRIRRILPALSALVIAVLLAGYFLSTPFHYQVTAQSAFALFLFASNIQFWRTTGYFSPVAEENPLLHTWSLSVEEQFYLFIPLSFLLLYKLKKNNWIPYFLTITCILSFIASVLWIEKDPAGTFYLLPARAWELGLGCLVAFAKPIQHRKLRLATGWIGALLIFSALFLFTSEIQFPGISALPVTIGSALFIVAGQTNAVGKWSANHFLSAKPFVFVGLTSYSFYLWHWPFFAYHHYLFSSKPATLTAVFYILLSFLISVASLYLIERPFRTRGLISKRRFIFAFAAAVTTLVLVISITLHFREGMPSRLPPLVVDLDSANGDRYLTNDTPLIYKNQKLWLIGDKENDANVLLWGDSHALAALPAFVAASNNLGKSVVGGIRGGTPPILSPKKSDSLFSHGGEEYSEAVFNYALDRESSSITHVVFILYWSIYFESQVEQYGFPPAKPGFEDAFISTISELDKNGIQVIVFRELPIFPVHTARTAALHRWRSFPEPSLSFAEHTKHNLIYQSFIERLEKNVPNVRIIDPTPYLLSWENQVEYINENNELLYKDFSHLTQVGAMRLTPLVESIMMELPVLEHSTP